MKKVLISHTVGNANTRGAVYGLFKKGILHSFHVCIAVFKSSWYYKYLDNSILKLFKRRTFNDSIIKYTHCYPFRELGRQLSQLLKFSFFAKGEGKCFSSYTVCQQMDKNVMKFLSKKYNEISAVYCYEDIALYTFRKAKENNVKCLYDLPIGYWRYMEQLLGLEKENNPDWAITLGGLDDSDYKHCNKDKELELADHIFVASSFTKKSLELYPGKLPKISVIPYGFPPVNVQRVYAPFQNRKIKVLYVGGLSQRKGISYLFDAIYGLENKVSLSVIGTGNVDKCSSLKAALSKCNYMGTMPHDQVLQQMAQNDVMIFPSLFEGFGLVITESMSQGTPVITTDRTCGPDVMTNGKDGWIVDAGSSKSIRTLLESFIKNPDILQDAGREAMKTASRRPWSKYEEELANEVYNLVNDGE